MKISIIIPAYNAEKFIEKCLNSISLDCEIIVVNDGSKDNTDIILKKKKNITIFNNDNHGVSYSRNFGIKNANGEYIMFLDSDDFWDLDIVEFLYEELLLLDFLNQK